TAQLNVLFPGVVQGDEYFLCVRTDEITKPSYSLVQSSWSCDTITVAYDARLPRLILDKYVFFNPHPECIACELGRFITRDPELLRRIVAGGEPPPDPWAPVSGLRIDSRGGVAVVYG